MAAIMHLYTSDSIAYDGVSGKVAIGATNPNSKFEVVGGDIEVRDNVRGLILKSPNGTRFRIKVDDDGTLNISSG